jgi:uncharacterized protein YigA (DUF484 family)
MTQEKRPVTSGPDGPAEASLHGLGEVGVAAYLRNHPGFLLDHPELLSALIPPSHRRGDNVSDFQAFMIEHLRGDLKLLGTEHRDLVATSRDNLSGQARVHQAALALLGAASFEHLVHAVATDLVVLLDLDVVTLCVEVPEARLPRIVAGGVIILQPAEVDGLLGAGKDIRLCGARPGERSVFGGGADLVRSSALLRLGFGPGRPVGLLALGTRHEGRFRPGQGTELLVFLAHVLEHCVRGWLDHPD